MKKLSIVIVLFVCLFPFSKCLAYDFEQPTNESGLSLSKDITPEQLSDFFEFSVKEYFGANYGMSRDLFELIAQRTNAHPMCYFYLSRIYTEVTPLANKKKAKENLLAFVETSKKKTKIAPGFFQDAYADLVKMETNHKKMVAYANASMSLGDSETARQTFIKAYTKAFSITHDNSYREKIMQYAVPVARFSNAKLTEASLQK